MMGLKHHLKLAFIFAILPAKSPAYTLPSIIQGGMGVRISSWNLAREVSQKGELGVISGTAIDVVMVRTLQNGDPNGHVQRALATFPDQDMAHRIIEKYYVQDGKDPNKPFRPVPMWTVDPPQELLEIAVASNYCEVWLAKHNDDGTPTGGLVGINRLTKVQLPTIASLYGAMLADVDYVIMGAGIPLQIPGVLDNLSENLDTTFPIEVQGTDQTYEISFSPKKFWNSSGKPWLAERTLKRPSFVPIVSSVVLAQSMLKRANGIGPTRGIQGFVVELPTAGGHNAPPRGFRYDPVGKTHAVDLNDKGEPLYGSKDEVDLEKFKAAVKGVPFWLAGSYAHPEKLSEIKELGGAGIQVGTLFALSNESGMETKMKQSILEEIANSDMEVFTDPVASPTGYPFKVLQKQGTLSDESVYANRPRVCSLGYLRTPYIDSITGKIGYRCPAEPVKDWLKKGGDIEATKGRKCLCNSLMANVGLPQVRHVMEENGEKKTYVEDMFITIGDEVNECRRFLERNQDGTWGYSASKVVEYLRSDWNERQAQKSLTEIIVSEPTKLDMVSN